MKNLSPKDFSFAIYQRKNLMTVYFFNVNFWDRHNQVDDPMTGNDPGLYDLNEFLPSYFAKPITDDCLSFSTNETDYNKVKSDLEKIGFSHNKIAEERAYWYDW